MSLPASQHHKRHEKRWQRYEEPLTGHQAQSDVKSIELLNTGPGQLHDGRAARV